MTRREQLLQAPLYQGNENLTCCTDLWIIPTRKKHDSGYNCMIMIVGYDDEDGEKKKVRCEGHIDVLQGIERGLVENPAFSFDCDDGIIHLFDYGICFSVEWNKEASTFKICSFS